MDVFKSFSLTSFILKFVEICDQDMKEIVVLWIFSECEYRYLVPQICRFVLNCIGINLQALNFIYFHTLVVHKCQKNKGEILENFGRYI